jgi:hypothetical protein
VIFGSPARGRLRPGDILFRVNGRALKDDLYRLDQVLNAHVGKTVEAEFYRNGVLKRARLSVADLEAAKIDRFVRFAGGVFHDITPKMRWFHDYEGEGVYMPCADEGSSFSRVGYRDDEDGIYAVVIKEINGRPIRNLDEFIAACAGLEDRTHTYVLRQDLALYLQAVQPKNLSLNLQYGPLEVFEWNPDKLEWEQSLLDLNSRDDGR